MPTRNIQLPSHQTHEAFGEINLIRGTEAIDIHLTLLLEPDIEGMQTGIALDGSASLRRHYGTMYKTPPIEIWNDLMARGMLQEQEKDGQKSYTPSPAGAQELQQAGYLSLSENIVEPQAQSMASYLAKNLDFDGKTTVIYWACGSGRDVELIGDYSDKEAEKMSITGPQSFGEGTHLCPAIHYFLDRFPDTSYGFYIFLTDGTLDDFDDVVSLTVKLCQAIEKGERQPLKLILIGIGDEINRTQLEDLDDLETSTSIDLWDHKIASEMRGLKDIFAEVVDEHMLIAPEGKILDHKKQVVANYPSGLPAVLRFSLPPNADSFTLLVGEMEVHQSLLVEGPVQG